MQSLSYVAFYALIWPKSLKYLPYCTTWQSADIIFELVKDKVSRLYDPKLGFT